MKIRETENSSDLIISLNQEASIVFKKKIVAKMKIAGRIDDARIKLGISKVGLAKLLKREPSDITKWLSGTHNFTINTIVEIEEALNISLFSFEDKGEQKRCKIIETSRNVTALYKLSNDRKYFDIVASQGFIPQKSKVNQETFITLKYGR